MQQFTWILDEGKFLSRGEVMNLKAVLQKRRDVALKKKTKTAVRDWFVINLALFTGLRVEEMSKLKHEDLLLDNGNSSLIVRKGKNGKSRAVKFGYEFKKNLIDFIKWKKQTREPSVADNPLIVSSNTGRAMTKRGIQKIFERSAERAGIKGHSIHHLRHTYASHLLKASNYNIELVRQQLGHSSIKVTEIYLHVLNPDMDRAVSNLYAY
jgi:site-specific recombinase XerD